jgi:poly(A) polymerase
MKPDSAIEIIQKLRDRRYEAYLVGGCVRDMVMGLEPADYDIATSARPEEIMKMFPRTEAIGVQFGVVLVIHHGHPYEVATFRSDEAYVDGRRPTGVVFTDAKTDVLRRDFTINGLLFDPIEKTMLDYVSGQKDIEAKIVRAIGNPARRFEEDKLRILRAIRFGARLGYTIEPETWKAVCAMAPQIHQVSIERIQGEIVRILTEGQAETGFQMLYDSGLLREVLPEVHWSSHLARCLTMLGRGVASDLAMAVLLHEVLVADVEKIMDRLKFSRLEIDHTVSLVARIPQFHSVRTMNTSDLKRFFRLPRFEDHLELERICRTASDASLEDYNFSLQMFRGWAPEQISPTPLITGKDLIELGFQPGPLFKEILTRVEDEQLEGRLTDRSSAVEYVTKGYRYKS